MSPGYHDDLLESGAPSRKRSVWRNVKVAPVSVVLWSLSRVLEGAPCGSCNLPEMGGPER